MSYTLICPRCLARQGAPVGGKLVSQEIGGCLTCRRLEVVFVYAECSATEYSGALLGPSSKSDRSVPIGNDLKTAYREPESLPRTRRT